MRIPEIAFKEWASIVLALERGLQDLVFRRGGIAEERDAFEASHDAFLLLPTYYHQQREGLREEHQNLFDAATANEPPPGRLRITSWAEVLDVRLLRDEAELKPLALRHVYARSVLLERLYRGDAGVLHVLEVRVHRLAEPIERVMEAEHRGCKSWVPVART